MTCRPNEQIPVENYGKKKLYFGFVAEILTDTSDGRKNYLAVFSDQIHKTARHNLIETRPKPISLYQVRTKKVSHEAKRY